jgi:hypothetical protein
MFNFEEKDLLPYASLDDIYKYCNHYDLFRHYVGNFTIGRPILSPLASEDSASFAIFLKGDKILFNDFRLGGGDIVRFVQMRFHLDFRQAINKIVHDAGLTDKFKSDNDYVVKPMVTYNKKLEHNKPQINVKRRSWAMHDVEFWKAAGIGKETLKKYRVSPIKYIFFGTKIITAERHAYCFVETKDDESTFTIYQPRSKENKWFKSHDASVFYGWSQLPETGDILIITKSMKDVMTIDSIMGIPVVAMQSEKTKPKEHIIKQLKERFKKVFILYDNDYDNEAKDKPNYGREFGKQIADEFNLTQVEIPDHLAIVYEAKDISDLFKTTGLECVKKTLNKLIYGITS